MHILSKSLWIKNTSQTLFRNNIENRWSIQTQLPMCKCTVGTTQHLINLLNKYNQVWIFLRGSFFGIVFTMNLLCEDLRKKFSFFFIGIGANFDLYLIYRMALLNCEQCRLAQLIEILMEKLKNWYLLFTSYFLCIHRFTMAKLQLRFFSIEN